MMGRMAEETDAWAPLAHQFTRVQYATVRGRVRTYVIGAHLRADLPPPPSGLIDVGGGNQSIPLARSGYQVTIADPSAAMLAHAAASLDGEAREGRAGSGWCRPAPRTRPPSWAASSSPGCSATA